jgi:hypothetical protein
MQQTENTVVGVIRGSIGYVIAQLVTETFEFGGQSALD